MKRDQEVDIRLRLLKHLFDGGLKDVASAMKAVAAVGTEPMRVDPNLEALKAALEN